MSVLSRANFADMLDPAFRKIFSDADKELTYKYNQVFNIFNSSKNIEKDSGISGLMQMAEIGEGEAISVDTVYQGYDSTYTHKKFGRKTTITEEMVDDDQYREVEKRAKGLAIALNRTVEQSAADVLNNGWTAGAGGKAAGFLAGGDGKALFATDHPRLDGGTAQSNSTTMDLAEDALETVLVAMRAIKDDRGELMLVQPDTLIVPPALEKEARILLDTSGRVGTANNDINPYQGRLNLVVWDFIGAAAGGSDTAWFVVDSKQNPLNWFWRKQGSLERNVDFDTGNIEYKLTARWSNGFSTWRGIYGSKGDNS
jgi:phage major head subunit gpT-like protein